MPFAINAQTVECKIYTTENKTYKEYFSDSVAVNNHLNEKLEQYFVKGFIKANYDTLIIDTLGNTYAYLNIGELFYWKEIDFSNIPEDIIRNININKKKFTNKRFNYNDLISLKQSVLEHYENNGYPFAIVKIDSIKLTEKDISGEIIVEKNNLIYIDSVFIEGTANVSHKFLIKYLAINKKSPYSEKDIIELNNRINELQFIKQQKPLTINFTEEKADINLFLDKKGANQFDGMIGFLPNNTTTGKLLVTGEINLHLLNSFKQGEKIVFEWQKLEALSQELRTEFTMPYVFSTNFGFSAKFDLLKKDTTYLNTNPYLAAQYYFKGNNYVKIFIDKKIQSIISTNGLEYLTVLPDYADVSATIYGFGIFYEQLDYIYNPLKGFVVDFSVGTGTKTIKMNNKINPDLYKDVNLNSNQVEGNLDFSFYQPIRKKTTIKFRNISGYLKSDNFFKNELYTIGGLDVLRGFDEKSIYASTFSISSIELRYLFEKNSNIYLFADWGWYEQKLSKYLSDNPLGLGFGSNFETAVGIFNISWALGKQFDNSLEINSAKIHFGYINRF